MRVTNSMTNKAAVDSGLPINGNSIMGGVIDTGDNKTLLDALDKKKDEWNAKSVDSRSRAEYRKLEDAGDDAKKYADILANTGDGSVYADATESGSTDAVVSYAKGFADSYNELLGKLKKLPDGLNTSYRQMLVEASKDSRDSLFEIGLSVKSDGTIDVDDKKLSAASAEALQTAFTGADEFAGKVSVVASHVADNAATMQESVMGGYGRDAYSVDYYSGGRYNFLG